MNLRSSFKRQNSTRSSPQSSSSDEEVLQQRLRGCKRATSKPEAADSAIDTTKEEECDLLDLISRAAGVGHNAEDAGGVAGTVSDSGLQESDEDSASTCSSIASGPSVLNSATPKMLCPGCVMLYRNAVTDKTPIKEKPLDNDPTSLTCDQWVLLKKWMPRRGSNLRRKSLSQLQFDKHVDVEESPGCWRPHPFLQRNLRCVTKSSNKPSGKKSRKKRTRKDSPELYSAKQQRLSGENGRQRGGISHTEVLCNTSQDLDGEAEAGLSEGVTPCSSVTMETSEPTAERPELNLHQKARGFRNLLLQLRGSMIVKETHSWCN
ncbi:uncharacterized protein LOC115406072 [Salarias fasciatus]|uniref:uncharacterized protein LOC115406072 n=1 Tax=Salarias fasciatus TaxID=181472 RepID=UPI001176981D|nr:uncharacterized protein LOC115406072 [Salarias fasciatus]